MFISFFLVGGKWRAAEGVVGLSLGLRCRLAFRTRGVRLDGELGFRGQWHEDSLRRTERMLLSDLQRRFVSPCAWSNTIW